jgi:hypothetical protein
MKNSSHKQNKLFFGMLCISLVMIPGCDWFSKKDNPDVTGPDYVDPMMASNKDLINQGEKLVCMGDMCIISDKSFDQEFEQLLTENPQLRSVLPLMPTAKENFLQGLISQAIVDRTVKEEKLNQTDGYKQDYAHMMRSVERMLNTKHFSAKYDVEVTDADVQAYYEANKTKMPDLLVSNGGIKAEGVSFATEEAAKNFAAAAKGKDFTKVAKDQKVDTLQDFKLVTEQSIGMNATLKNKILATQTVPSTEVVKADDKTFWVIRATEKQEAKYLPLEQVFAGLKQYVEKERRMAILETVINEKRKEYHVTVNEEYFVKQKEQQKLASGIKHFELQEMEQTDAFDQIEPSAMNVA